MLTPAVGKGERETFGPVGEALMQVQTARWPPCSGCCCSIQRSVPMDRYLIRGPQPSRQQTSGNSELSCRRCTRLEHHSAGYKIEAAFGMTRKATWRRRCDAWILAWTPA
jgi:hypothetical protein